MEKYTLVHLTKYTGEESVIILSEGEVLSDYIRPGWSIANQQPIEADLHSYPTDRELIPVE